MALPLSYNVRNVRARWRVTLLAVLGIALVVAVFEVLMSMSEGFASALRSTGRADNAIILQRGVSSEGMSTVQLEHRQAVLNDARIERRPDGQPMGSWETLLVLSLPKQSDGMRTNVTLRAVSPQAFEVRGGIRVTEGRRFGAGLDEVIVGRRIMERVRGLELGGTLKFRRTALRIVGVFESEGAAFESEVWGDYDTLNAFRRRGTDVSSLVVRMKDAAQIPALHQWLQSQPGMALQALPETLYYERQAGGVATALKILAGFVALVTGVGAVFGAMNTMYAVVAVRTREIGTLRAIGFSRRAILLSFVLESALLALLGGAAGSLAAFAGHGYSTGAASLQSFSEIAYAFRITPAILAAGMGFALALGVVGGLLPSVRAARLPIAGAVREA